MDSITQGVIAKIKERAERGLSKYGVSLDRTDLSVLEWLNHALCEAMDLAEYLEKLIRLNGTCEWRPAEFDGFHTGCDTAFQFTNGGIKDNDFTFCPFCGRKIEEAR
jgi:hypothetical protein